MTTARRDMLYEVRYLCVAPALLWLYWQYALFYVLLRGRGWTWPLWLSLGLAFALQNVAFNATLGSFLFWERPRQWYFSDRIRASSPERQARYKRLLNYYDPEHI